MYQQLQDRPTIGNGDGHTETVGPDPGSTPEYWIASRLAEERRAARQLRHAVRRVTNLYIARSVDLESAKHSAFLDIYRFVLAAVDEHRARDHFQQMTLELEPGNG